MLEIVGSEIRALNGSEEIWGLLLALPFTFATLLGSPYCNVLSYEWSKRIGLHNHQDNF